VNPEYWSRIKELFGAAIQLDPAERGRFLDDACGGNAALRREVEALIASHDAAGSFIEEPVYAAVPELFETTSAASLAGRRLGAYQVLECIGQGGMGVVFLAEDTRLGRRVAMKALAPELTSDPEHRARLRREARAAAALTHPGVAAVYALEELDGVLFIVREYVPGETLREELSRGPLAPRLLAETALELARTLAATHERGVIHRDLKPENVIRTPSGGVKIVDFGLARIEEPSGAPRSVVSRAGTFLGTPAYASPEQLGGAAVDFRTDIFSLGVMLYELATGEHPFASGSGASLVAKILDDMPPDLSLAPPGLAAILRRCLAKDPAGRYGSTRELAADLERLAPGSGARPAAAWWWQFHQLFVASGYYGMLYPAWRARVWTPGARGTLLFLAAVAAVGVAANLRLHLWFTSRFYPAELPAQRARAAFAIRAADIGFAVVLAAAALLIHDSHPFWAALLLGAAVADVVSVWAIEPATTRAAFGPERLTGTRGPLGLRRSARPDTGP
jgi:predicted Ser/Thr protein kinase